MAQLKVTAIELSDLLKRLRKGLAPYLERLAMEIEEAYAKRHAIVREAKKKYQQNDKAVREDALLRFNAYETNRKWWQKKISLADCIEMADSDHRFWAGEGICDAYDMAQTIPIPQDDITPVLDYLEALTARLDPDAKILLSEQETYQIVEAEKLACAG